jgi:hypothetical protein
MTLTKSAHSFLAFLTKADPYGRDVPTEIPTPQGTPQTVPGGAFPFGVLKPIPVNVRDIEKELNSLLDSHTPRATRWLRSTWNANSEVIKDDEIANAIRDGQISQAWVDRWQQQYAELVNTKLGPEWLAASQSSAAAWKKGLSGVGIEPDFALLGDKLDTWVRQRSADFVVDVSEAQRRALNSLIHRHTVVDPLGPKTLGQFIRPMIGLTERETASVSNLLSSLLADGVPEGRAAKRAAQRTGTLRRRRAERIARTELAFAHNYGGFQAVREAIDQDLLEPGEVMIKRWSTQLDERVCPFCGPLHDQVVGMEGTFPGLTKKIPNIFVPPAHPMCRCLVLYEIEQQQVTEAKPPEFIDGNEPLTLEQFNGVINDEVQFLRSQLGERPPLPPAGFLDDDATDDERRDYINRFNASVDGLNAIKGRVGNLVDGLQDQGIGMKGVKNQGSVLSFAELLSGDPVSVGYRLGEHYTERDVQHQKDVTKHVRSSLAMSNARNYGWDTGGLQGKLGIGLPGGAKFQGQYKPPKKFASGAVRPSSINVSKEETEKGGDVKLVAWHETGHYWEETNGRIRDAIVHFRTTVSSDSYASHYSAEYWAGRTEVLSEALGFLSSNELAAEMWQNAPEQFALATAALKGRFGYRQSVRHADINGDPFRPIVVPDSKDAKRLKNNGDVKVD